MVIKEQQWATFEGAISDAIDIFRYVHEGGENAVKRLEGKKFKFLNIGIGKELY